MRIKKYTIHVQAKFGVESILSIIPKYLTIIPWVHIGYEMVDSQWGAKCRVGYNHLISNKGIFFIKNAHKISRILPDFIWKNNRFSACFWLWADAYSYQIWRAWYDDSYTMMAKPIRALELHYSMIQFLIITNIINFYT